MKYLLTCNACRHKTPVDAGRAGQSVRCECGKQLEVPSIRELRLLERAPEEAGDAAMPAWNARKGLLFIGAVLMAAGLAFGGYLWAMQPALIDREAIDLEVQALSPADSFLRMKSVDNFLPAAPNEVPWPEPWQYRRQKKAEEIPVFIRPSLDLLGSFEGRGAVPMAPGEAFQSFLRGEEGKKLRQWYPLAIFAVSLGLLLLAVGLAMGTKKPRKAPARTARK